MRVNYSISRYKKRGPGTRGVSRPRANDITSLSGTKLLRTGECDGVGPRHVSASRAQEERLRKCEIDGANRRRVGSDSLWTQHGWCNPEGCSPHAVDFCVQRPARDVGDDVQYTLGDGGAEGHPQSREILVAVARCHLEVRRSTYPEVRDNRNRHRRGDGCSRRRRGNWRRSGRRCGCRSACGAGQGQRQ